MSSADLEELANESYKWGFSTDVEQDIVEPGLDEDIVRLISSKKEEPAWLLEWRLGALRRWREMEEPHHWPKLEYPPIDYQAIRYYAAPKVMPKLDSLDDLDPEIRETYEKLGIPIAEQERLAGVTNVAVDAVFDSVSVATTYKKELEKHGVIFCSFSEAVHKAPELVKSTWVRSCRRRTIFLRR